MGGLARKATILENLINNNESPIILDAGDLYFKKEDVDPGVSLETAMINAEIITNSFNAMGCDAFSPGSKDFAGGLEFLLTQYKNADFPYISCNISNVNRELLFQPYIIKKHKGFNIGINCGEDAGQTILHCHIHLIPRRKGDMEDPKGGVRGVIPDKQKY